jgi:hypothetical protein
MISAAERRERAAHRGDSDDIAFSISFLVIDNVYGLHYVPAEWDGRGDTTEIWKV